MKSSCFRCPDTKTTSIQTLIKLFPTLKQKPSHFRSLRWMKSSQFRSPTLTSGHFRHSQKTKPIWMPTQNQVIFGPHTETKTMSTTHTNTNAIDLHTENKSFSSGTQNQVNFDPILKPSHFPSTYESQVIFGARTKQSQFQPPAFGFRMDKPSVYYKTWLLYLHYEVLYRRIIRFMVRSDVMQNSEYGRSGIGAETTILIPSHAISVKKQLLVKKS